MPLSVMVSVPAAGVRIDADAELAGPGASSAAVGDGREAQPVAGIGGVGDQLAQEDLPVAVQGVDHELQQLAHLGLEAVGLPRGRPQRARARQLSASVSGSVGCSMP